MSDLAEVAGRSKTAISRRCRSGRRCSSLCGGPLPRPRATPRCGVDGTDKEINATESGAAPEGYDFLIIGYENFGRVETVGPNVTELSPGDYVAAAIWAPRVRAK